MFYLLGVILFLIAIFSMIMVILYIMYDITEYYTTTSKKKLLLLFIISMSVCLILVGTGFKAIKYASIKGYNDYVGDTKVLKISDEKEITDEIYGKETKVKILETKEVSKKYLIKGVYKSEKVVFEVDKVLYDIVDAIPLDYYRYYDLRVKVKDGTGYIEDITYVKYKKELDKVLKKQEKDRQDDQGGTVTVWDE